MEQRLSAGVYLGQIDRRFEVADLILTETRFSPGHTIPTHVHENAYFRYVLTGSSTDITRHRTLTGGPGTLVFHPADDPHANQWLEEGGRSLNIEIPLLWLGRIHAPALMMDRPIDFTEGLAAWTAQRIYREFTQRDPFSALAIEGLVLQLLTDVLRSPAQRPEQRSPAWLRRVRDRLDSEWAGGLTLGDLASSADVHPDHLSRTFRTHYGVTLSDYIRQRRIEHTCQLIAAAETSLADIALAAGFYDQSHFTRTFKRYVGMTPVEFQRSCAESRSDTRE